MARVVFLRGVNVGGHRRFRPVELVRRLSHLDPVNVGAAGTFVVRRHGSRAALRTEIARELPFETEIIVCEAKDILRLVARDPFRTHPAGADVVRFVSVLSRRPPLPSSIPMRLPPTGPWLLKVMEVDYPFVLGMYRRQMKAIGLLGALDRQTGVPVTTRNWNTIVAIEKVLTAQPAPVRARAPRGRSDRRRTA